MEYGALQKLTYGLFIIATEFESKKAGYIANTVFQVTSSPPQLAISCHKNNNTLKYILQSGVLAVSVLGKETPASLIGEFGFMSGSDYDKFLKVKTVKKTTGAPVITDSAVAWLDCRVKDSLDLGSHLLIICQVEDSGIISGEEPLTYSYYREKFKTSSPRNAPTYIEMEKPGDNNPEAVRNLSRISDPEPSPFDDEPYICSICGYIYHPEEGDPAVGVPPGTSFSDLPEDYRCPVCNAGKDYFKPIS